MTLLSKKKKEDDEKKSTYRKCLIGAYIYIYIYIYTHTVLPKVLGHPLLMKGLTALVISMSTSLNV